MLKTIAVIWRPHPLMLFLTRWKNYVDAVPLVLQIARRLSNNSQTYWQHLSKPSRLTSTSSHIEWKLHADIESEA